MAYYAGGNCDRGYTCALVKRMKQKQNVIFGDSESDGADPRIPIVYVEAMATVGKVHPLSLMVIQVSPELLCTAIVRQFLWRGIRNHSIVGLFGKHEQRERVRPQRND